MWPDLQQQTDCKKNSVITLTVRSVGIRDFRNYPFHNCGRVISKIPDTGAGDCKIKSRLLQLISKTPFTDNLFGPVSCVAG